MSAGWLSPYIHSYSVHTPSILRMISRDERARKVRNLTRLHQLTNLYSSCQERTSHPRAHPSMMGPSSGKCVPKGTKFNAERVTPYSSVLKFQPIGAVGPMILLPCAWSMPVLASAYLMCKVTYKVWRYHFIFVPTRKEKSYFIEEEREQSLSHLTGCPRPAKGGFSVITETE